MLSMEGETSSGTIEHVYRAHYSTGLRARILPDLPPSGQEHEIANRDRSNRSEPPKNEPGCPIYVAYEWEVSLSSTDGVLGPSCPPIDHLARTVHGLPRRAR